MTLTYSDLQGLYRREKSSPTLIHVEENFYQELMELLSEVEGEYKEHAEDLVKEIFDLRKNKVLMHTMRIEDTLPVNATAQEQDMYKSLTKVLATYRGRALTTSKPIPAKEEKPKVTGIRVRILRSLPSLIGSDAREYGPLEEGEEIEIPADTARILIEKEFVEELG